MNIYYINHTLFESSYRCKTVRKRLAQQIMKDKPKAIIVSGVKNANTTMISQFKEMVHQLGIITIVDNGQHQLFNQKIVVSDANLLINNKLITPIEGSVSVIKCNPFFLQYIVLDIFADETFADYHSDLDEHHIQQLSELLTNKQ